MRARPLVYQLALLALVGATTHAAAAASSGDDSSEPNDTCAQARAVKAGTLNRRIVKPADPDWYRVSVPGGRTLRVRVAFDHASGNVDVDLHRSCKGKPIARATGSGDVEVVEIGNPTAGAITAYWRVYLASGPRNTYTQTVTLAAGASTLSVAGSYPTSVSLLEDGCGGTTVQPNTTLVEQATGSHALRLTHAGNSYDGTVADDGTFVTAPRTLQIGDATYTIGIGGTFSATGFEAQVTVDVLRPTAPGACRFVVQWLGDKDGPPNVIPD